LGILTDKQFWEDIYRRQQGMGEIASLLGTAVVAEPISGLAGLLTANPERVNEVQNALTYQPKGEVAQGWMQSVAPYAQKAGDWVGDKAVGIESATGVPREAVLAIPQMAAEAGAVGLLTKGGRQAAKQGLLRVADDFGRAPVGPKGQRGVVGGLPMDEASRMARAKEMGYDRPVFHGSTHDIDAFDANRTNPESDFGQGIYSSNTIDDVNVNYAGEGPDLTQRIDREAERIASELDLDYSEDSTAEVDANFVMTGDGRLIEVQGSAEGEPFYPIDFTNMLDLALQGNKVIMSQLWESEENV